MILSRGGRSGLWRTCWSIKVVYTNAGWARKADEGDGEALCAEADLPKRDTLTYGTHILRGLAPRVARHISICRLGHTLCVFLPTERFFAPRQILKTSGLAPRCISVDHRCVAGQAAQGGGPQLRAKKISPLLHLSRFFSTRTGWY